MATVVLVVILVTSVITCTADVYLHNPRGSNNRQKERSATRTNANRLFDSQNNNRGGYNVGDNSVNPHNSEASYYRMVFFESGPNVQKNSGAGRTKLEIEWTNQHGCGGNEDTDPHKQNCNIVLQMQCQENTQPIAPQDGITMRDGINAGTIRHNPTTLTSKSAAISRKVQDAHPHFGLHEPWFWYDSCYKRERNKGLFSATQNLAKNEAISTRQNPKGTQRGYECPEERDYFPYWHPTPFIDIAVLAQNESFCEYYKNHSFNRNPKYECVHSFPGSSDRQHYSKFSTEESCRNNGGQWTEYYNALELAHYYKTRADCEKDHDDGLSYKWGKPWDMKKINEHVHITDCCFVQPPEIDCKAAGWTRSNHLGNGRDGVPLNYTWTLPHFPSSKDHRCYFRIRYNISTDDYDPYNTDASHNGAQSPVQPNPLVEVGENKQKLRLAINTAQTGRTFQDRSHIFIIQHRPSGISDSQEIVNLNVRGKRGNLVQTYPAVEYDFVPNNLVINKNTAVHFQWTGSNTHNNNGNGGDGQAGADGQGQAGKDRSNLVQIQDDDQNFPLPESMIDMFSETTCLHTTLTKLNPTFKDIAIALATNGFYHCIDGCPHSVTKKNGFSSLLDTTFCSFSGFVLRFNKPGIYHYMCTRNNNFSNRSQKGYIKIK